MICFCTYRGTTDPFRERGLSNSMEQQKARHDSFTNKREFFGTSPAGDMTSVKLVSASIEFV